MTAAEVDKLQAMIDSFDTAMLATQSLDGELRARPMAIADRGKNGLLYFATRSDDEKLEEIIRAPRVVVTMQGDGKYLSISGEARLQTDLVLADELWSESMRLWFPEGPADSSLTVLLVEPSYAEYWDRTGVRRLEFWWEAGKALLAGRKADDLNLGGHDKVKLK